MPAATEISICLLFSLSSLTTDFISHGLTASMISSAPVTASWLSRVVCNAGNSAFSTSNLLCVGLETMMSLAGMMVPLAKPRAIDPPIFPAPIIAVFISSCYLKCCLPAKVWIFYKKRPKQEGILLSVVSFVG